MDFEVIGTLDFLLLQNWLFWESNKCQRHEFLFLFVIREIMQLNFYPIVSKTK